MLEKTVCSDEADVCKHMHMFRIIKVQNVYSPKWKYSQSVSSLTYWLFWSWRKWWNRGIFQGIPVACFDDVCFRRNNVLQPTNQQARIYCGLSDWQTRECLDFLLILNTFIKLLNLLLWCRVFCLSLTSPSLTRTSSVAVKCRYLFSKSRFRIFLPIITKNTPIQMYWKFHHQKLKVFR